MLAKVGRIRRAHFYVGARIGEIDGPQPHQVCRRGLGVGIGPNQPRIGLSLDNRRTAAARGTYFDPQCGLVIENYLQNRERYLGTQGYTAEGFAAMEKILPTFNCSCERVIPPPWRMDFDAKILIRSAPACFCFLT